MLPVTVTPNSINLLLDGRMRTISKTHLNYDAVSRAVKDYKTTTGTARDFILANLRDLVDIPSFIARITEGRVRVGDHGVMFDSEVVEGVIADRLMSMLKEGYDPRPLARFLQRLKTNPMTTAVNEMYLWLESGNLPITEDGCFLAFKLVEEDFASGHRNVDGSKVFNVPGTVVEMEREYVDPDRNSTCSRGLHFCSWQYLPQFGVSRNDARVVVLKIAPEDVVSIPYDYNNSKGRAWRYLVLEEAPKDECEHLFANRPVVNSYGVYDASDDEEFLADLDEEADEEIDVCTEEDCGCTDTCEAMEEQCSTTTCPCDDGIDGSADTDGDVAADTFEHGTREFTRDEVKQLVADYGQRGMSRMTGVPRSTIQDWLKQINEIG